MLAAGGSRSSHAGFFRRVCACACQFSPWVPGVLLASPARHLEGAAAQDPLLPWVLSLPQPRQALWDATVCSCSSSFQPHLGAAGCTAEATRSERVEARGGGRKTYLEELSGGINCLPPHKAPRQEERRLFFPKGEGERAAYSRARELKGRQVRLLDWLRRLAVTDTRKVRRKRVVGGRRLLRAPCDCGSRGAAWLGGLLCLSWSLRDRPR